MVIGSCKCLPRRWNCPRHPSYPQLGGASHSEGLRRLAVVGPSPVAVCVEETGMTRMVCVLLVGVAAVAARTVTAVGREP